MSVTTTNGRPHRFGIYGGHQLLMPSSSPDAVLWEGAQCSRNRDHQEPYYYCMRCDEMVCRDCWFKMKRHRRLEPGHEETRPNDAIIVHSILKARLDEWPVLEDAIKRCRDPHLRQNDDNSEWFGVRRKNGAGDYSLVEGLAYNLIADFLKTSQSDVYPRLVSFVGGTGSGKSTLIGLLSKFSDPSPTHNFKTPAVGDSGSCQSTSSNVHLYVDPQTYLSESPILYAECEDIDGGEIPTEMERSLAGASASSDPLSRTSQILELDSHDIIWSKMPRNSGAWTRKEIIRTLFPRILYIFSDMVVFPFSRTRPGDTIFQLVKWGHNAMVQSYNKPVLPSAVIVFLNRDDQVDHRESNLYNARESFFEDLQDISKDKTLQPYLEYWKVHGQHIVSAKDLLSCYYSSVSVVHLPSSQRPTAMRLQIEKLRDRISQVCSASQERRNVPLRWNAATRPLFVRKAFTHFASKYETPFNFSDAWVDLQNFAPSFASSIFSLARMVRGHRGPSRAGISLWVLINDFVASCLFLNCVRAKQADLGATEQFWKQYDQAIEQYCVEFWPCEYRVETPEGHQRCVNALYGHPHHQAGKAVKRGYYSTSYSLLELKRVFRKAVLVAFDQLKPRFKHLNDPERLLAVSEAHLNATRDFYMSIGGIDKLISHLHCLVCLDGVPEHSLPCGHVICRECAKATGDSTPGIFVTLQECPLQNHRKEDWPRGLAEYENPSNAGFRTLSIDENGPDKVSRG